jgi:thioredoxin-dependent peroxiredoxin
VFGISFDTPEDNKAFREAQGFGYSLLSDVHKTVGAEYEVVRDADDKYANFPQRHSYLIDPHGVIRKTYVVSDVAGHAAEVLADIAALAS